MSNGRKENKGDSVKITREYFDSLLLEMRLIDSDLPSIEYELFGSVFSTPIMTAALSHLNRTHPDGMVELARGAAAANAVMWAGMGDDSELERIIATGAKTIKIIKPYADEDLIMKKIEHAERHGALAVGMDLDHAFSRRGGYDKVLGHEMRPKSQADIVRYVRSTNLPFVIKGVLSAQDAQKCLESDVSGIVVSHHHGVIDYAVPPLMVLPEIADVIGGQIPIFIDCAIERGYDVFKALALGANAASVGRALMPPLAKDGAEGVKRAIEAMSTELAYAMAMTGSPDPASIDPDTVWS
ncbi:MAG: alpha-hydroxy-acid oxidizing protein [Oscillospiraceae bacterium]|nr:alpha-hydroxy-acid oxidizing protein [Oscillospiraceae bacterium]